MSTKFIFVAGGVISSVGKGVTAASIGKMLIDRGYQMMVLKIDPYLNLDAGTMSPFQHGEVFVTADGAETDLDLGHYERMIPGLVLTKESNFTSGSVFSAVFTKERKGEYLGQTVQLVPHVVNEIKARIYNLAEVNGAQILITEIGGTIGDFEMPPFIEAIKQIGMEVGRDNVLYVYVSQTIKGPNNETKTKPTQHSVRSLLGLGIFPDVLVCRTSKPLDAETRKKLAIHCGVYEDALIEGIDVEFIEEVPANFEKQGLGELILQKLNLDSRPVANSDWEKMIAKLKNLQEEIVIGFVGKYNKGGDSYISIVEALKHAGIANDLRVNLRWISSEDLLQKNTDLNLVFKDAKGILVPGGFGYRGIEGKLLAVQYARERKIPFLGLCLGMQCMVIEFARNVCGLDKANSSEFDPDTPHPVIDLLPEQKAIQNVGGTMRLGSYPCVLQKGTKAFSAYKQEKIFERHRHRYEVDADYFEKLTKAGLIFSGVSPNGELVEITEVQDHPWMLGTQFHPEFQSRPLKPHPLFVNFILACKS